MYSSKEVSLYDTIYLAKKDYSKEAERLHELIQQYKQSEGNTLLDVACGTGLHLIHLKERYAATGVDLSDDQLAIARERHPALVFTLADMTDFDLGRQFDIVACLFSSIGYVKTVKRLRQAMIAMAKHLKVGGVLFIEPWIEIDKYQTGALLAGFVDLPELKISRMHVSQREGNVSIMEMHYLVGRPGGIETFTERHEMGLFSQEEYLNAITGAGLIARYDEHGLMGRGLYIGMKT